ncbi:hypothetical protein MLD38_022527 [Melastoma candidum]|uniref:Uncharacterized protein n=1 Tax=Melastoma candidum TaxID=119954 RepID=A0ACB9QMX5_9MYRT|nr:hypothetical protein MLD38_022527 [Melastoma candidum]
MRNYVTPHASNLKKGSTAGTSYNTMAKAVTADLCKEEAVVELPLVECRICLDEDIVLEMEIPCECRGNLMYAHKACIHKWYHMRRKNTCEICLQPLKILAPCELGGPDHNRQLCENEDILTIAQAFESEQLNERQDRGTNACLRFLPIISFQAMLLVDAAIVVLSHLRSHKGNHNDVSMSYIWWSFFIAAEISILVLMGLGISLGWLPRVYLVQENRDGRRVPVSHAIHFSCKKTGVLVGLEGCSGVAVGLLDRRGTWECVVQEACSVRQHSSSFSDNSFPRVARGKLPVFFAIHSSWPFFLLTKLKAIWPLIQVLQTTFHYEPYEGFNASVRMKMEAQIKEWEEKQQRKTM